MGRAEAVHQGMGETGEEYGEEREHGRQLGHWRQKGQLGLVKAAMTGKIGKLGRKHSTLRML